MQRRSLDRGGLRSTTHALYAAKMLEARGDRPRATCRKKLMIRVVEGLVVDMDLQRQYTRLKKEAIS